MSQRPALVCTGFEHGSSSVGSGPPKAFLAGAGTWSVTAAAALGGAYGLRLQPSGSAPAWALLEQTMQSWPKLGALRFRLDPLPSTDLVIALQQGVTNTPSGWGFAYEAASGGVRPFHYRSDTGAFLYGASSPAIAAGDDYRIEFAVSGTMGTAGNSITVSWRLAEGDSPGSPQTDFSFTWQILTGLGNRLNFGNRVGPTSSCTLDVDDVLYLGSTAAPEYPSHPLGPLRVLMLRPVGDGTHVNPADFTDSGGASPPESVYTRLDDDPWPTSPSDDHVYQDTANSASYLELNLGDPPPEASAVLGGEIRSTHSSPSTGVANARVDVHRADGTAFDVGLSLLVPVVANSIEWQHTRLIPPEGADLTLPLVSGAVVRVGKSTDVSPLIRVHAVGLEVAFGWGPQALAGWGIILA